MAEILGLALPFFGLILIGFIAAKIWNHGLDGLAWLHTFIIYFALPALFFQLLSKTPIEKLASVDFIFATLLATYAVFALSFAVGTINTGGDIAKSTIHGLAGAYGNVGYMGPGLALAVLGPQAAAPVAIIFCFDNALHFTLAPLLMAIGGTEKQDKGALILLVLKRVFTHPFIIATILGLAAATANWQPPLPIQTLLGYLSAAAAPCALFVMGITIAGARNNKIPLQLTPLVAIKLLIHPLLAYLLVSWIGDFEPVWVYTAVLMAALPTATNVFVIAGQYKVEVAQASTMVVVTTVASVISLTGILYLISKGILPHDLFPN